MVSMLFPTLLRQTHSCLYFPAGLHTVRFRGFRTFLVLWEMTRAQKSCCVDIEAEWVSGPII